MACLMAWIVFNQSQPLISHQAEESERENGLFLSTQIGILCFDLNRFFDLKLAGPIFIKSKHLFLWAHFESLGS